MTAMTYKTSSAYRWETMQRLALSASKDLQCTWSLQEYPCKQSKY